MLKTNKIYFPILLAIFYFGFTKAQINLVPNPSFESYTACPTSIGEIYKASGWDSFNGSPDYFNVCGTSGVQVPSNSFGYQLAAHGNGYGGIITYYNGSLAREIMGVQLLTPLILSQKYFVSFMVNRGNDNFAVGYSTNKMGVKFSTVKSYTIPINNSAHYFSNTVITDTLNWIRIIGSFTADSAYQYLMIGNFFDDINTTITNQSGGIYAYYFIDDVCLSTDSIFTYNYSTGIKESFKDDRIKMYPNPADEQIIIENPLKSEVRIFNSFGEEIRFIYERINPFSYLIMTFDWKNGLYFIKIGNHTYKIIINH